MPSEALCAQCRRGPGTPLPRWLVNAVAVAFAFGHAGMWAKEELSKPYCGRCRARLIPFLLFVVLAAAALIGFGLRLWLRGP